MNVIIFGARGQLGQCLADIVSSGICAEFLSREDCDLLQPDSIKRTLDKKKPDFIINAAAYTDVDRAESEAEVAHRVNGKAVGAIAEWVSYNRARLIHLSTDFVFDGKSQRPYQINDKMNPLGAYGASKEAGEKQVKELAPKATMVIRTSWVYSEYGSNFVKTMLRLMRESKSLSVVDDQLGSPTYAGSLARIIWTIINMDYFQPGIFHWTDNGTITWYQFACTIQAEATKLGLLNRSIPIKPISTDEYPTSAKRPAYSALDTSKLEQLTSQRARDWQLNLNYVLNRLKD
tara:strand:+ start:1052 stop:1921 length:870 start_codon:yes stop_codon:yes gene_type:complete